MFNLPIPPLPIPGLGLTAPTGVPVGTVVAFAGKVESSPSNSSSNFVTNLEALGWMVCDGREYKISEYPELFAVLGDLYGGETNENGEVIKFKIPDYRGYFLRGVDGGTNNDPDASIRQHPSQKNTKDDGVGSQQEDALQNHQHPYLQAPPPTGSGNSGKSGQPPPSEPNALTGEPTNAEKTVRTSTETRPKNVYVYYIIKYTNC